MAIVKQYKYGAATVIIRDDCVETGAAAEALMQELQRIAWGIKARKARERMEQRKKETDQ